MKIMFDVDGVLADFILGFTTKGNVLYGAPIVSTMQHVSWGAFLGMTKEQENALWEEIKVSRFWENLPRLADQADFDRIASLRWTGHDTYFVTSRVGKQAKEQTELWLQRRGIPYPTVIVSSKKGEIAAAIEADYSIEDKAENAWCVRWMSPTTKSFLIDRPYNRYDPDAFGSHKVRRVQSVGEYLDIIAWEG